MAVDLGSAYIQIIPSLRGAGSSIQKELGGIGSSSGSVFGGGFLSSVKGAIAPLAGIAAAAIGAGAVGKFFTDSISAASDLQQSLGGVDAIFGKSAAQIHEWAEGAQTSVGLSENAYNQLAAVIGSQLKNAGTSMDQVGVKTDNLIKQGSDLAATFGGTTSDAVEAISSALKGETDPIERYGVSLTAAAINAKGASLGFKAVGGNLSVAGKQAATMALILQQTSSASGQFSAQTNTLAEQQQIFGATLENVKAKIGTAFLPALTSVTGVLSNALGPALKAIQPFLTGLSTQFTAFGAKLPSIASALGGVFGSIGTAIGPVIGSIAAAFATLGPALVAAVTNLSPLGLVFKALAPVLPQIATLIGSLAVSLGGVLTTALGAVVPFIATLVTTLSGVFVAILPTVVALVNQLAAVFAVLAPVVSGLLSAILPLVGALITQLVPIVTTLISGLLPGVVAIIGAVSGVIKPLGELISAVLIPVIAALLPVITTVFNAIVPIITAALQIVTGIINVFVGILTGNWSQAFGGLKTIVSGAFNLVVGVIRGAVSIVGAALKFLIDGAVSIFKNFGSIFVDAGKAIITNFVNGITGAIGFVKDAIGGVMNVIAGFFPHSPAKTGPFSGAGWRAVAKSGGALASQFTSGFNGGVSDFAAGASRLIPDTISSSVSGSISGAQVGGTSVLINNKTSVRLEDLIDVQVAKNSTDEERAMRLGYQPLVFG